MSDELRRKWYIAGPMTGIPQFNFPRFMAAAAHLRELGYYVVNPAELDTEEMRTAAMRSPHGSMEDLRRAGVKQTWGDVLARDVRIVADEVDTLLLLPGWARSRGARLEVLTALQCGHDFFEWTGAPPSRMWFLLRKDVRDDLIKGIERL